MLRLKCSLLLLLCFSLITKGQRADSTNNNKVKIAPFIIPAVFIGYGLMAKGDNFIRDLDRTTQAELQEDHPFFSKHADDFMRYVPALAVYGLNLAGVKGRNSYLDATGNYVVSMGIMTGMVAIAKKQSHRLRPDGSGYDSFPSGHSAASFVAAEFLKQEYKDVSPWIGYAGYAVATTTGVFRLYNNKHWVSDVVAGAGVGILSAKLGYLVYPQLKKLIMGRKQTNFNLVPAYQQGAVGFSMSGTF
ncbi:phosphatase PAP2 family protein [Pedobacter gandavensis]|uniref:Phosphatase PAP2 family protein n=1 Tax=Pedobacter gandavensis TaxID=2679963 RepID=A0ABR6EYM3_9SPHI|nr:phosphatase PAP2 family protein [Pedobacter gandavensis]MBB2150349.1 phosphatase PAP2 family protein [Pedobacter gandavensis]